MEENKRKVWIVRGLQIGFVIYWGYTLICVCFVSENAVVKGRGYRGSNLVLFVVAALLILLFWRAERLKKRQRNRISDRAFYFSLIVSSIFVFGVQILCAVYIAKPLAYDFAMLRDTAIAVGTRHHFVNSVYFSRYGNNLHILTAMSLVMQLFGSWFVVVFIGILAVDIAVILSAQIAHRLTGSRKAAELVFFIGVFLYDFSYRTFVPYTDNWAVCFWVTAFFLWVNGKRSYQKTAVIALLIAIGCFIKITTMIPLIAAIVIFVLYHPRNVKKLLYHVLLFTACFLFMYQGLDIASVHYLEKTGFEKNEELAIGMWHYFMMGQNDRSLGAVNMPDVEYTRAIEYQAERNQAARKRGIDRIKSRGLKGNLQFYTRKNIQNYYDGCFSLMQKLKKGNSFGDSLAENIFVQGREYFAYYAFVEQLMWMVTQILILLGAVRSERKWWQSFLYLSIFGVSVYLLLFESRAKYLYLFVPIYLLLAGDGVRLLCAEKKKR